MMSTELDGMVRQEQYKDMIRDAREASRVAAARPRGVRSPAKTLLLLPVLLVSVAARLSSLLKKKQPIAEQQSTLFPAIKAQ